MKYENKEAFEQVNMFGTGTPNTAYAKFFIGDAFLNPLTDPKGSLFAANVTFEPACRNNWHIHHATIRMILTIAATMMSTWMAIMIRTGTTGMMIMQPAWMMPSRKISRMETKGTGKGNIREFLISGTETQKMV